MDVIHLYLQLGDIYNHLLPTRFLISSRISGHICLVGCQSKQVLTQITSSPSTALVHRVLVVFSRAFLATSRPLRRCSAPTIPNFVLFDVSTVSIDFRWWPPFFLFVTYGQVEHGYGNGYSCKALTQSTIKVLCLDSCTDTDIKCNQHTDRLIIVPWYHRITRITKFSQSSYAGFTFLKGSV